MQRLRDTLIRGQNTSQGSPSASPQVNLALGGQYGYQPRFEAMMSNAGYVPRNLIPILLVPPRGFQHVNNPMRWTAALKSIMENQAKNITGFQSEITIESAERNLGAGGHMQHDPTNALETMSTPSYVWDERYGRPIHHFWEAFSRTFIMEPTTKQPGLMTFSDNPPDDHLPDIYSFTMMYIEPDPLLKFVNEAFLVVNMYPNSTGSIESTYDATVGREVPELTVEFSGTPIRGEGVRQWAQELLDENSYINAGPMQRPSAVQGIAADVAAAEEGYREGLIANAETGIASE